MLFMAQDSSMESSTPITRSRASRLSAIPDKSNATPTATPSSTRRNTPFLPTPIEAFALAIFPTILLFGALFYIISPQTRAALYDSTTQAHIQDTSAPSYFARKGNVFNTWFVKKGWGWTAFAFVFFLFTHPSLRNPARRTQALVRFGAVTTWWFLITQWCFGPPIIDRGFQWSGGACQLAEERVASHDADAGEFFTAVACKAAGGRWSGGHDISGHVFLLVLGCGFLMQEVGWVVTRWAGWRREDRSVVMSDGAVKGAGVESTTVFGEGRDEDMLAIGGKVAVGIMALECWMLLMTAIYFHTWFEKLTGLLAAMAGLYLVYVIPRFTPVIRQVVGLPGI